MLGPGIELRRTSYDFAAAAAQICATAYPGAEEFATNSVLRPPAEEAILERFASVELK